MTSKPHFQCVRIEETVNMAAQGHPIELVTLPSDVETEVTEDRISYCLSVKSLTGFVPR